MKRNLFHRIFVSVLFVLTLSQLCTAGCLKVKSIGYYFSSQKGVGTCPVSVSFEKITEVDSVCLDICGQKWLFAVDTLYFEEPFDRNYDGYVLKTVKGEFRFGFYLWVKLGNEMFFSMRDNDGVIYTLDKVKDGYFVTRMEPGAVFEDADDVLYDDVWEHPFYSVYPKLLTQDKTLYFDYIKSANVDRLVISDMMGNQLKSIRVPQLEDETEPDTVEVDMSEFNAGSYLLVVVPKSGKPSSEVIVIK